MQQFDGGSGGVGQAGIAVAAGLGHRQAQARADACTAGEDSVADRRRQQRRAARAFAGGDGIGQRLLDALQVGRT